MAQISDRSPRRGCEQREWRGCECSQRWALTLQHSTGAHEHSMVLEGRWLCSRHHVPSQQKWHMTGLGGMGSSWDHVTMRWMRVNRSLQPKLDGVFSLEPVGRIRELLVNRRLKAIIWAQPLVTVWLLYTQFRWQGVTFSTLKWWACYLFKQDMSIQIYRGQRQVRGQSPSNVIQTNATTMN